jgi:zinc transporter ZupT
MLGASFGLVAEGMHRGPAQTVLGGLFGVVFVLVAERLLERRGVGLEDARGAGLRRMVLILTVMTAHSFAEGVAVGVSFGAGAVLAVPITLAIAVHNIPEGLAISAVLRPQGATILACVGWSIVSSLPQPLMAVPAFLFVEAFAPALPYGLGFAAGAMVFMVLGELLPEAYEEGRRGPVAATVTVTLVAMVLFQHYL